MNRNDGFGDQSAPGEAPLLLEGQLGNRSAGSDSGAVRGSFSAAPPNAAGNNVSRSDSKFHMLQISLGMLNFEDTFKGFPIGHCDSTGKVGLSWRVAILPFVEQDELFKQFKLDEPWDSEHNKKLIPLMPKTYAAPRIFTESGMTHYRAFTGPGTVLPPPKRGKPGERAVGLRIQKITDGSSITGIVVEAADPVIWTKPDELVFDPNGPLPRVGGLFVDGYRVTFADGSVLLMKPDTSPATLKAIITANGGEPLKLGY